MFSGFVALISEERRAAISQLLAERTDARGQGPGQSLLFAANTDEISRVVTGSSLVLVEGSRLSELAAGIREGPAPTRTGELIQRWLDRLPSASRTAFAEALRNPRAWSVKRVAHRSGISTRQLVRHCRAAGWALSPRDVLLAARLVAAQDVMRQARTPRVTHVAHACGWIDARSLRAALRRGGFGSLNELAKFQSGAASVSEFVTRLQQT